MPPLPSRPVGPSPDRRRALTAWRATAAERPGEGTQLLARTAGALNEVAHWANDGQAADPTACAWLAYLRWAVRNGAKLPGDAPHPPDDDLDHDYPLLTAPGEHAGDGFTALSMGRLGEVTRPVLPLADSAEILARTKAQAVAGLPEAAGHLVLGCDSVFELDGRAYGKPGTGQAVRERLRAMSGRTGILHTGHWLVDRRDLAAPAEGTGLCVSARVSFAAMTPEEIDAYAATGEPLWVAGSFTLEGYGAAFITGVEGDPHAVQGLSVHGLRELLGRLGVGIQRLWRAPEQTA